MRVIARVPVTAEIPGRQARIAAALGGLRAEMARSQIMHVRAFRRLPMMVFSVTEVELDTLIDSGLVDAVHEDRVRHPHLAVSIPYIGGDIAHNFGYQVSGVAVAILDTGIDARHRPFGGRVVEAACCSP